MSSLSPRARALSIGAAGFVLAILAFFGAARGLRSGEVLGSMVVAGTDVGIGGMDAGEVADAIATVQSDLEIEPIRVTIVDDEVTVLPQQVGFELAVDEMVTTALERGRTGGLPDQFRWWLGSLFSTDELPLIGSVDAEAVEAVLAVWDSDVVGVAPIPGGVSVNGTTPVAVYPMTGLEVDRDGAADQLLQAALGQIDAAVLGTTPTRSRVTGADVDAAVAQAELWLSAPVELSAGDVTVTFGVADLASAFRSTVIDGRVTLGFDPVEVGRILEARRSDLESAPVDAVFDIRGFDVVVVPGRSGTLIDPEATAEALAAAASSVRRSGTLPFEVGVEPEVTTEELESLGVTHLISEFTTYFACCQDRVTNIQLIADYIDGAIVLPGDTFGVNDYVGERTLERGFLPAGSIILGELVETVGGGISQFATTLYNAVFWAGLEDVEHRPHSFYFNRYPEGIEATVNWQRPELAFRNDTANAILIDTAHTNTSITVRIYGDNDGRILVGDHESGNTDIQIVAEGGPNARRVAATTGERFDPTEPDIEYRANPELEVDEVNQLQSAAPGWTVAVTRTITVGDDETEETWNVRYRARREIIEVHPCKVPDAEEECPEPSTTTTAPGSTTTPSTEP